MVRIEPFERYSKKSNKWFIIKQLDVKIMLIDYAPGVKEDEKGKLLIVPSGTILDKLLDII